MPLSDSDIKALVRKRDGYRCRDCGMTDEEHVAKTGRGLDVHRLIPGEAYSLEHCVTLCRACHGKKPKRIDESLFDSDTSGLLFLYWNLYDQNNRRLFDAVKQEAESLGMPWHVLLDKIFREHFDGHTPDYVI